MYPGHAARLEEIGQGLDDIHHSEPAAGRDGKGLAEPL